MATRMRQFLLMLLLMLMLMAHLPPARTEPADYDETLPSSASGGDPTGSAANDGTSSSSGGEIYEPALLQQVIETEEAYRNSIERETLDSTELPNSRQRTNHAGESRDGLMPKQAFNDTNSNNNNNNSASMENISAEQMASSIEETSGENMTMLRTGTTTMSPPAHHPSYEYTSNSASSEDVTSDYINDDESTLYDQHQHQQHRHRQPQPRRRPTQGHQMGGGVSTENISDYVSDEQLVPNSMDNTYHDLPTTNQLETNNNNNNSKNKKHRLEPALPQAQMQMLPKEGRAQPFKQTHSTEDYDNYEDGTREFNNNSDALNVDRTDSPSTTTTTTATITTTTSMPITTTPTIMPALQTVTMLPPTLSPTPATIPTPPPAPTTTTTMPTITRPLSKQPKVFHSPLPKPELLPEQLRNYIKDVYIRMPLAVIVDPSAASLEKTKVLYNEALHGKNINVRIVLVTLNDSGVPAAFSFNNTHEFLSGLNSTKEHEGGNAFIGVLHAAELVPYDSAVFISTAAVPPRTELVQDAAITLLKKRIRLFLLWYGEQTATENETEESVGGILGEVAIRSGGEIIHIVGNKDAQEIDGGTLTLVADAYRGSQELEVPVDTTMSSLHLKIDAPMRRATLVTPNGEINLKKLVKFKPLPHVPNEVDSLDAYVPLNKLRKSTVYTLKLTPEVELINRDYYVFLRAERKADIFLGDVIKRFDSYYPDRQSLYPTGFPKLTASEGRAFTSNTHASIKFPTAEAATAVTLAENDKPKTEVETFSENEVLGNIGIPGQHNQTIAVTSVTGNQRTSTANYLYRCGTKIEMGTQSQLLVSPGTTGQILFEVTNMRGETVYNNIQVTDERRYLLRLSPQSIQLGAYQTATVSLTVLVPTGTVQGTIDRITFTTHGRETSSLSLVLKVVTSIDAEDTTAPTISWEFGNRCNGVAADSLNCAERFWSMDLTAQDWQSGILRLQTTPSDGLFYRNSYTVGSNDVLKASYMATCCEPKVSLLAYDTAGNQRSYNIDVRDIVLTEASIAAIALGAVLLLLLIVLLIASIVWCCRRRKVSLELPTYRSHSTRSME